MLYLLRLLITILNLFDCHQYILSVLLLTLPKLVEYLLEHLPRLLPLLLGRLHPAVPHELLGRGPEHRVLHETYLEKVPHLTRPLEPALVPQRGRPKREDVQADLIYGLAQVGRLTVHEL